MGAGGDEGVEALDCFFVADAEARFVAGQAVDFGACVAPGYAEKHVGDVALIAGAVVGWVELVEEIAGWVGEGVLLKGQLAVEVDESGFGSDQVLEAALRQFPSGIEATTYEQALHYPFPETLWYPLDSPLKD